METKASKLSITIILLPLVFLLVLWLVYWLDWRDYLQLYKYGVYPRTLKGIRGVAFSPFIHGGIRHLYNNSVALLALLVLLQYFYKGLVVKVLFFGILLSGFGTWLIARESYHIGASGLIYALVSFMFFKGIFSRYYRLVALSLLIVVFYGSMIWYMFPDVEDGISWEGHLSGFIAGMVLSVVLKTPIYARKVYKYEWERPDFDPQNDPFMSCFDEKGNFIILVPEPEQPPLWCTDTTSPYRSSLPIVYVSSPTNIQR